MSDPRLVGPQARSANLSKLMKLKGKASLGEKVNLCPFHCDDSELDDNGYCYHLIGFTNDGKKLEPMVALDNGGRGVKVPFAVKRLGPRKIKKTFSYEKVEKGDKLVRITSSARVYRDVPRPVDLDEPITDEFVDDDDEVTEEEAVSIENTHDFMESAL